MGKRKKTTPREEFWKTADALFDAGCPFEDQHGNVYYGKAAKRKLRSSVIQRTVGALPIWTVGPLKH